MAGGLSVAHDLRSRRERWWAGECLEARCTVAGFVGRGLIYPHAQIVPRRLASDRIVIALGRITVAVRQHFRDQMVEQKTLGKLWRVGRQVPRPGALADRVPGPHRVRVYAIHQFDLHANAAGMTGHPNPIVVDETEAARRDPVHEQTVATKDLAQPGILRMP